MPESPVRLAVVGLGMAATPHLAGLRDLSDTVEVSGLYSRNADTRARTAADAGFPVHASVEEICADPTIDAVLLLTPPSARLDLLRQITAAGKHVLMEKPLERTLAAAQEAVAICEAAGITTGVVFQHRFRAGFEALSAMLRDGVLGQIALVRCSVPWWRPQSYYDEPGRGTYAKDGGGVLLTQAVHILDLLVALAGPAREVQAMTGTTALHRMEAEDFATAGVLFQNGALGSITATTAAIPGGDDVIEIETDRAAVRLSAGELTIRWRDGRVEQFGEAEASGGGGDPMDFPHYRHRRVIADFARALTTGGTPRVAARDALGVHRLIDAIERSNREGRRVDVAD
jgi:predicted dehydrogenase